MAAFGETCMRPTYERLDDGAGYGLPFTVEYFGRLGNEAARFLNNLGVVDATDSA